MNTRIWALAVCLVVLAMIVLRAPSLGTVRFEAARPIAFGASSDGRFVLPALSIPEDTPLLIPDGGFADLNDAFNPDIQIPERYALHMGEL